MDHITRHPTASDRARNAQRHTLLPTHQDRANQRPVHSRTRELPPATPVRLAGGNIRLHEEIPLTLNSLPLHESHRLAGKILLEMFPDDPDFEKICDTGTARHIIEKKFTQLICDAMSVRNHINHANPSASTIHLHVNISFGEDAVIDSSIMCNTMGIITPDWLSDPEISDPIKSAVFQTIRSYLPKIMTCGSYKDLFEEYSCLQWGGETTDAKAIETMRDEGFYDDSEEPPLLPSDMKGALPSWYHHRMPRIKTLPPELARIITTIRKRAKLFDRDISDPAYPFWANIQETVYESYPAYEDCSLTPPLWIMPDTDIIRNALEEITDYAMQTGFFDISAIANIRDVATLKKWLSNIRSAATLLNAIEDLLAFQPESSNHVSP